MSKRRIQIFLSDEAWQSVLCITTVESPINTNQNQLGVSLNAPFKAVAVKANSVECCPVNLSFPNEKETSILRESKRVLHRIAVTKLGCGFQTIRC